MKGVADEVVESVLENTVMEMARDMACEVCFEEEAPDIWEFQRQGSPFFQARLAIFCLIKPNA